MRTLRLPFGVSGQAPGRERFKSKVNFKSQIKGVGQECPTHTVDKTLQYGL